MPFLILLFSSRGGEGEREGIQGYWYGELETKGGRGRETHVAMAHAMDIHTDTQSTSTNHSPQTKSRASFPSSILPTHYPKHPPHPFSTHPPFLLSRHHLRRKYLGNNLLARASLSQMKKERPCCDQTITLPSYSSISASFRGNVMALAASAAVALLHTLLALLTSPLALVSVLGTTAGEAPFLEDVARVLLPLLLLALSTEVVRTLRTARVMLMMVVGLAVTG